MTAAIATVTSPAQMDDSDVTKVTVSGPTSRQIPIRLPQATPIVTVSNSASNSRVSSAAPRLVPINTSLQRQRADFGDIAFSSASTDKPPNVNPSTNTSQSSSPISDFTVTSPIRRAEVMAREAIQGLTRLQHHQRNQTLPMTSANRSPSLSRRVIINLQNNQSVLLDSRLSSSKPPPAPNPFSSSARSSTQKNNLFYIPVLHEIQMPSDSKSSATNGGFKNEFHMEIPVTVVSGNEQENHLDQQQQQHQLPPMPVTRDENGMEYRFRDRSASTSNSHSNQTLKSILKRSSSRDNVPRKNVSFMNT